MRSEMDVLRALEAYRIGNIAETVAMKLGISLVELHEPSRNLYEAFSSFGNPTDHLLRLASSREVISQAVLTGEKDDRLIHYSSALSKTTEPIETLYIATPTRVVVATWGFPQDVGVLEVINIEGGIALQELNRSPIVNINAPRPQRYGGVVQFQKSDFSKLYQTIDTLLR